MISVVFPIYNCVSSLERSILSLKEQTYPDFECLLIYDESEDGTLKEAKRLTGSDSRFKILHGPNTGLAAALNFGVAHSCYEYIARMDADDYSFPERFAFQLTALRSKHLDIVGSWFNVHSEKGSLLIKTPEGHDAIGLQMFKKVPFAHGSVMFKKSIFEKYDVKYSCQRLAEDFHLWISLFSKGAKFGNVQSVLFEYYIHEESLSHRKSDKLLIENYFLTKLHAKLNGKILESMSTVDLKKSHYCYLAALLYIQNANISTKRKFLLLIKFLKYINFWQLAYFLYYEIKSRRCS